MNWNASAVDYGFRYEFGRGSPLWDRRSPESFPRASLLDGSVPVDIPPYSPFVVPSSKPALEDAFTCFRAPPSPSRTAAERPEASQSRIFSPQGKPSWNTFSAIQHTPPQQATFNPAVTTGFEGPPAAKNEHALWVGNLPPQTTLLELRNFFGSPDILSIYLIERTGCAFVNFRSAQGLAQAQAAFLQTDGRIRENKILIKSQTTLQPQPVLPSRSTEGAPSRYFVCKSLSPADLEAARRTQQWSTQAHNAERFNTAFRTSKDIYFIFSANKASSYFGYARMTSLIPDGILSQPEAKEHMEVHPTPVILDAQGSIKCPEGKTVEHSRRAGLFWQVADLPVSKPEPEQWTPPCQLKWLSFGPQLTFSDVKHLRNPLNGNKPVKIARDGTEIDPAVGETICEMLAGQQFKSA